MTTRAGEPNGYYPAIGKGTKMPENEAPAETKPADEGATPDTADLGEAGKRAIQAERNARKAAEAATAALQAKLDKAAQDQMSDLDRAKAEAKSFEDAAAKAQSEALRWRIAARHGITDDDAETFLTGSDETSLTRQAERLRELAIAQGKPGTPKPDRTQGGSGDIAPPVTLPGVPRLAQAFEQAFTSNTH